MPVLFTIASVAVAIAIAAPLLFRALTPARASKS
jgi:hypothetical protein